MEIACPSCRKTNETSPCPRCGCDLTALFAVNQAVETALATAAKSLRESDPASAADSALRAWELRHSHEAAQLGFLAALALNDPELTGAWLPHLALR